MAIAFRSASTFQQGSGTSAVVPKPSGVAAGDVMVAAVTVSTTVTVTAPSGWTTVRSDETGTTVGSDVRRYIFTKAAGSSEPTTYTFTLSTSTYFTAGIAAYTGVDNAAPVNAHGAQVSASSTSITAPSVSPSVAGTMVVGIFATWAGTTITPPSGMTERFDVRTSEDVTTEGADELRSATGPTGTRTATAGLAGRNTGALVALAPANTAPNAPILTAPADGSTIDRTSTQRFDWDFSDPDTGDSQSKYDLRYRLANVAKNEIQTVTISGAPTGGTFTLTYSGQTTAAIAYNATAAAVQTALEALSNIGVGDVAATGAAGGPWTVTFQGALGATDVAQMTATSSLTGGTSPTVTVATTQQGVPYPAWTDVTGSTPNTFHDFPAATFAAGDYEWQARTYDAQGVVGPYSASSFFTAATPTGVPTITAPTSGGTVSTNPATVTWSTAGGQDAYQVRRVADNAGSPDTTTVYYDTGQVNSTTARSASVPFETDNRYEHIQVRVLLDGLWSSWASIRVLVSYTPPAAPVVTLSVDNGTGSLWVDITNPTPGSGEPTAAYNAVEVDDGDGWERKATMLQPNYGWRYWTPVSGRDYSGNVRVVTYGDNGTTATTTVPAGTPATEGFYYGGGYE